MLDDMFDHIAGIRDRPVWQPIPARTRARFRAELPRASADLGDVYREFHRSHRAVHDRKCPSGLHGLGARRRQRRRHAGRDAGGRAERQSRRARSHSDRGRASDRRVDAADVRLSRYGASGIFVTGTSMANLLAVLVARSARLGPTVRQRGVGGDGAMLTAYTSVATHGCIAQAMDLAGFGTDALRRIAGRSLSLHRCRRVARADRARSRRRLHAISRGRVGRNG